jgi:hypothetical protein
VIRTGRYTLTICAAGHGVRGPGGLPVVCGEPPGHDGDQHRDIQFPWLIWPVRQPGRSERTST